MNLEDFLARLMPIEFSILSSESVRIGTQLAAIECLTSGITSVLDMYWFPSSVQAVGARFGLRIFSGPTFIESEGPEPMSFPDRLEFAQDWLDHADPHNFNLTSWLMPHSTYLLGADHLKAIAKIAQTHRARITVHVAESKNEIDTVANRHGERTPVQVLFETGLLENAVLAHGVHLTDEDIQLVAGCSASVAHCPASNFKLASGVIRLGELTRHGVNVALGSDGPASGNDIDLWFAMRLAGYVQKVFANDAAQFPAAEIVRMATINGAKALGIDHLTGSIEVGKAADLVVLDANSPSLIPTYDPYVSIATSAGRGDVKDVIVNGEVVVRDRALRTVDIQTALKEARSISLLVNTMPPTK
jgi:5-methylthioadenosine/S-adenosylhomocysteine deaminase